ncbi:MAG: TatD family hydrolase [Candidatus Nezhaarchaeales archaeon]|nr:MAG: TatD family deoxyribonuclease [Candidatus Nezhaarchaeota archaeon WYZ-LMO7]TDA36327.1 MAG: TatD family deoxyribonuclease [Candidatus Nezhaarchaeota archaeon WYZ-LMO8]
MYFDAHCHLHEFSEREIGEFKDYVIAAVSDDLETSKKTLRIAEKLDNIVPCIGVHPWIVDKIAMSCINEVEKLVSTTNLCALGEVGLDRKFVPQTFDRQLKFFKEFVRIAVEHDVPMNLHAAGAWREVYEELVKRDVERAMLHWYTGPIDLLEELTGKGYFISINPALKVQKKHMVVAMEVDLRRVLIESDAPYEYRGLNLTPKLIPKVLEVLANVRGLKLQELKAIIESNFRGFFRFTKVTL